MEAVLFTGAEALVVSVLTDRLKFLEGDRLDLLERHLFNLHLGFERLFFLLDQRLRFEGLWRIETGQQPTIEGGQIAGANQLAVMVAFFVSMHRGNTRPAGESGDSQCPLRALQPEV